MPVFEVSGLSTLVTATANAPLWAFRASTIQRARIREIHLFSQTAPTTSGGIGLARSSAQAVTPSGIVTGVQHEPNDVASGSGGTAAEIFTGWGTAPTIGTVFRRWASPASLGNGIIWTWDITDPLVIPASAVATGDLCFVNLNATAPGTYQFTIVWEE